MSRDPERPTLSVIVASIESETTLPRALDALAVACADLAAEIIVVDASRDRSAAIAADRDDVTLMHRDPDTLTPVLWGDGIKASSGRFVALTTGHCIVRQDWATALVRSLTDGAAGVGAGLELDRDVRALDRAIFYLRYTAFLDQNRGEVREVHEIAGDNAAYVGNDVRRYSAEHPEGFWEIEYHRELRGEGGQILANPAAVADFGHSFPFGVILKHRFDHGRHFGRWRVHEGGQGRLRVLLASPLVPIVLLLRAGRRAWTWTDHRTSFVRGTIPFLVLAVAWAAGEGAGSLARTARA